MPLICHLDITILEWAGTTPRRDTDNRVKTIRDALRIPHSDAEVREAEKAPPDPCLCLLEDDGSDLIGRVTSETRQLLERPRVDSDVMLWIQIDVGGRNR